MASSLDLNGRFHAHYRKWMKSKPLSFSKHHHLLVACMPKSGSTYLRALLAGLPGMRVVSLVPGYGRREQELDVGMLRATYSLNYVAQHHVRYSEPTGVLLDTFDVKPIVLVRNIFDVVISLRDHFRNDNVNGSMGYTLPEMVHWENEKLEEFIANMWIPWYFNFYMSWVESNVKNFVRYEDLVNNPTAVVAAICDRVGLQCNEAEIEKSVHAANQATTRLNKGVAGRGENLPSSAKERILEMASWYEGVDFSPIGLQR